MLARSRRLSASPPRCDTVFLLCAVTVRAADARTLIHSAYTCSTSIHSNAQCSYTSVAIRYPNHLLNIPAVHNRCCILVKSSDMITHAHGTKANNCCTLSNRIKHIHTQRDARTPTISIFARLWLLASLHSEYGNSINTLAVMLMRAIYWRREKSTTNNEKTRKNER